MTDYRHVLAAIDLSQKEAGQVAEHARDLAQRFDARLSLLHVSESEAAVREARAFLDRLAESLSIKDAQVQVSPSKKTKEEILRVASEQNVDLIVVGTHGRHGLALLLGSTANAILPDATCDVLAVRLKST